MKTKTNHNSNCVIALTGLHDVVDPEVGLNVVDMGLIYELNFDETQNKIDVLMTLSTRFCPMGESIVDSVKNNLTTNFADWNIKVELTFNPSWNLDMISEEGRIFLNR